MDTDEAAQKKIEQLADMVKNSKHLVVIVGAGISTACGIPDFRGPKGEDFIASVLCFERYFLNYSS